MLPYAEQEVMGTFLLNDNYTYTLLSLIYQRASSRRFNIDDIEIRCAMRIETLGDIRRFLSGIDNVDDKVDVYVGHLDGTYDDSNLTLATLRNNTDSGLNYPANMPSSLGDITPYVMLYCREKKASSPYECILLIPTADAEKIPNKS